MEASLDAFCSRMSGLIDDEKDYEMQQTKSEIENLSPKV
jgi:hypothetical protein